MRVFVVGGTGLIGRRVVAHLADRGDEVVVSSRSAGTNGSAGTVRWDPAREPAPSELTNADALVNLAGASIVGRWTAAKRRAIRDSRVITTERIAAALAVGGPRVLVNASAVGWYGDRGDEELTEASAGGTGFLAEVCAAWEAAAKGAEAHGVRVARARIGLVLDRAGGVLPVIAGITRAFAGGPVGGGRQWYPWVHAEDVARAIVRCLDDDSLAGPVNVTAPSPARQREVASVLGRVLKRPAIVPTPGFTLRLALGEAADLVLGSCRALPARLQGAGFTFEEPDLEHALARELP